MQENIEISPRLSRIFAKTKLLCFGRYAIEAPEEAQLVWGTAAIPSDIDVFKGGQEELRNQVEGHIKEIMWENNNAEIQYSGVGPMPGSWQIRYYKSPSAKKYGLYLFKTYVSKKELFFVLSDATRKNETEQDVILRQEKRARNLRTRGPENIPTDPGYCIKDGFLVSDSYGEQEMVAVGLHFPSFPDVTFSLSSNKNAYGDYSSEEFESRLRPKLSLLARLKEAQDAQGLRYPFRAVLREGKRNVHHWRGEESLFRRKDGTHDFEWASVGTPRDIANPSEFGVAMFTKVAHNTIGAAKKASLTDEEAIALWDKLLSGLKFRVKVPGAPEGSYYFLPGEKTSEGAKP